MQLSDKAPVAGTLYVCATPIGNLGDVTERLRTTLAQVSAIACEDSRVTRRLLSALGVRAPQLILADAKSEQRAAEKIIERCMAGDNVALMSDAGTPGVSDPGCRIVADIRAAGIEVCSIPGPSAVGAAISVAGMSHSRYTFVGFLPRTETQLLRLLRDDEHTLIVAFESPRRLHRSLSLIAAEQPGREIALCRELTKMHEAVVSGSAASILGKIDSDVRGEIVLVLGPMPERQRHINVRIIELVESLVEAGIPLKAATKIVGGHEGVSARELYSAAVERKQDTPA